MYLRRLITLSKLITSADSALFHQVVAIYFSSQGVRSTISTPTTHLSVGVFTSNHIGWIQCSQGGAKFPTGGILF
ncbi:hypothetical protein THF1D04_20355 [Vibrio owensii]|uniref:Uncharacterized protein n=1 Tax=Vibrio owensii TaxID=696485 RepID=A0AAU9Q573_9VIBR|nr:hypothetical protein THF1D04_20355 [Vibrio owensii]